MTTTNDFELTYAGGWTVVAEGAPSVTVQLKSDGPIMLQVAAAEPDSGSFEGFLLSKTDESSFTGNALAETDNVYLRVLREGDSEIAAVMAT